ncbi:MAG: DUF6804 family protein [Bacteroidia bacterium]
MEKVVKIVLAALLVLCLADMPYGYFQFVRFAGMLVFGYLAYTANERGLKIEAVVFVVLAVLFQPLMKISLGREIWNIVDVIVALGLLITLFIKAPKKDEK